MRGTEGTASRPLGRPQSLPYSPVSSESPGLSGGIQAVPPLKTPKRPSGRPRPGQHPRDGSPCTHLQEASGYGPVILGQHQVVHKHPEEGLRAARPGPRVLKHTVELEQVPPWGGRLGGSGPGTRTRGPRAGLRGTGGGRGTTEGLAPEWLARTPGIRLLPRVLLLLPTANGSQGHRADVTPSTDPSLTQCALVSRRDRSR